MSRRRDMLTLLAYLETGSHKAAADRLGIAESTSKHRVGRLIRAANAANAAQAAWLLRTELDRLHSRARGSTFVPK